MSVEELKELLGGKDVTTKYSKELADDKVKQLRAEVAFLKSENHRLQQEITSQEIELRRYKNSFIIRF